MSTLVYYECRDPGHLAAPSRYGVGGIVFRHGTAAYCDGLGTDAQHHWVPTGGVPIESLVRAARIETKVGDRDDGTVARTGRAPNDSRHADPLPAHP
jgi:hypothetical protein